jgi:AraC family transcriptional regulator of adaptative response / DNA-3-methyladenine glycosylase II
MGEATDEVVLRLAYRPPYDWTHLHRFLASRAIPHVERIADRSYARIVATPAGGWAIVQVRPADGENALEFRVSGADPMALLQLSSVARRVFDLAADPATIAAAFAGDSVLAPLVERRPGLRIPGVWDEFECAVRAIVGQQVSFAAGLTLVRRLVERAGQPIPSPIDGLTHVFPAPRAIIAADLGGLGLTANRIGALKALAAAIVDGTLNFGAGVEEVTAKLMQIRGIGAWTAHYVALRALGDPDAFPSGDLVLRKAASASNGTMSASALDRRAETWRPWRAYAAIHLWSAATYGRPMRKGNLASLVNPRIRSQRRRSKA